MPDELKKILQREFDELKKNKIRATALAVCFAVLLIFWITDDSSDGEEINLNEPMITSDEPPATKDLPVKILPVEESPDGVTLALGANADELFIGDPFAGKEKVKNSPPKIVTPPIPPIVIQPPPLIPEIPAEKIILTGTAISDTNKMAMFLRGNETLFKTIGEEINGREIVDISPDFVMFEGGEKIFIQRELK